LTENSLSSVARTKGDDEQTLHVAVVHTVGAVRLVAAASSQAALAKRLADYVRQHPGNQLWAREARCLRRLLAAGQLNAAIELYFTAVGKRWDEEWLVIEDIEVWEGELG
jgi:hypothetical protein